MEATSKKRGRPPRVAAEELAHFRGCFPEVRSRRGLLFKRDSCRALGILLEDGRFAWLCSTREEINAGKSRLHYTLLAELGRIEDEAEMKEVALLLCEQKPQSKRGVAFIRACRLGRTAEPDAMALTLRVIRCVDDYRATHPATTPRQIFAALENARDALEEVLSDAGDDDP
jgi:hypothetical protein